MLLFLLTLFGDGAGGGGSSGPAPETKAAPRLHIRVGV